MDLIFVLYTVWTKWSFFFFFFFIAIPLMGFIWFENFTAWVKGARGRLVPHLCEEILEYI